MKELWRVRWLKADYVLSCRKPRWQGFVPFNAWFLGSTFYADLRQTQPRKKGWAGSVRLVPRKLPEGVSPLFHPFRYYVLHRLNRIIDTKISRFQILYSATGFRSLVDRHIQLFKRWSRTEDFTKEIERWNGIVNLAVALEPFNYPRIIGSIRGPDIVEEDERRSGLSDYWDEIVAVLKACSLETIERVRLELVRNLSGWIQTEKCTQS